VTPEEFRTNGYELIDPIAEYLETVGDRPVTPSIVPGDARNAFRAPAGSARIVERRDGRHRPDRLRVVESDAALSMQVDALADVAAADIAAGFTPYFVCTPHGTPSSLAFDPTAEVRTFVSRMTSGYTSMAR
jgi:hypothetical protein